MKLARAAIKVASRVSGAVMRRHQNLHARLMRMSSGLNTRAPYVLQNEPSLADRLVIHFNGNFAVGGSTQLIVDLIELSSDAYRHEIVVPHRPDPIAYRPVDLRAIEVDRMEEVRALLIERRPSLVHIHYWSRAENRFDATGVWYATVLAICDELDLPVIQNINVPTQPMRGSSVLTNVYVSNFVMDDYGDPAVPAAMIHPGSDFTHFARGEIVDAPDTIGMVYRLDGDKLNERSIEPFILVAKRRPSTKAIIVGEGVFSGLFRRRVAEEGLTDRIEFAGLVSYADLPALYRRMGVFVAPVHNESFGQVTPFAMSMGLPVVGYEVGALSEILGDSKTLVRPEDAEGLAQITIELLERPADRVVTGASNLRRAHDLFSRERMVERYRDLYAATLRKADLDGKRVR